MNRTNICKNIVQSIKDYITDQVKLEPHRMEKHFVRRRKLSLLQVIIYLFFIWIDPYFYCPVYLSHPDSLYTDGLFQQVLYFKDFFCSL